MLHYQGPYKYTLIFKKGKLIEKLKDGKLCNFSKPLTTPKRLKIYIIRSEKEILYIGYTRQSISQRLYFGLNGNNKKGRYDYKWRNSKDQFELLVFVFVEPLTGEQELDNKRIAFVEAIEAELVYQIRVETGNWPTFQNEIHFNNKKRSSVLGYAKKMYEYIKER